MVDSPARLLIFLGAIALFGCDSRPSSGAAADAAPSGAKTTSAEAEGAPSATENPAAPTVPSWADSTSPEEAAFAVSREGDNVWLTAHEKRLIDLRPTLVTQWIDDRGAEQTTTTPLPLKALNREAGTGFTLYLEAEDELGRWRVRAENSQGDPRLKFAISGKYSRDIVVARQELLFELPGESAPEVLLRGGAFETAQRAHSSHAFTPQRVRWADRKLTYRGGPGVDGYRVEPNEGAWTLAVQTFDAQLHPTNREPCGPQKTSLAFARLKKKTKVEARWQFVAGVFDEVLPSNFPGASLGGLAVVIDDAQARFEATKTLDVGVPTIDSDGALELGLFYTRVVPAGEPLAGLGGLAKTANRYGVEYAPRGGDNAAPVFRERFDSVTWWGGEGAHGCEQLGPEGPLQERVNAGYRLFYSGRNIDGFDVWDPANVERGAAVHAYPHKLERGSPTPTAFGATTITSSEALSAVVKPGSLDNLKEARGLAILHTTMDTWVTDGDKGKVVIPGSKGTLLMLTRYRNERRLAVGPVRDIVGHAAAMQSVDIELLPTGWVRVRNMSPRDLKGASFVLPSGAEALFPRGANATTKEGMVYFDLPARGEQVFQVTGAKNWMAPVGISVASGE